MSGLTRLSDDKKREMLEDAKDVQRGERITARYKL